MRMRIQLVWPLVLCLAFPGLSAEVVHVVKEPTGTAVQAAIDACAAQGGGVVCLPPGRYVSGPLWLKDNIELRLETGATVVLSHDRKDWPAGARALVNAKGARHIAMTPMMIGTETHADIRHVLFSNIIPSSFTTSMDSRCGMCELTGTGTGPSPNGVVLCRSATSPTWCCRTFGDKPRDRTGRSPRW